MTCLYILGSDLGGDLEILGELYTSILGIYSSKINRKMVEIP
jgi:hypothetical protein